jgi:hypothetical protein
MSLDIPDLTATNITRLYFGVYAQNADEKLLAWVQSVGARHQTNVTGDWWLHDLYLTFTSADGEPVVCGILNLDKVKAAEEFESVEPIELLKERFSHFTGRQVDTRIMSTSRTPLDRIPKNGKIDALLGVTTDAGKARLEYVGAKTRVHGTIFNDFSWELARDKNDASFVDATVDGWQWNFGQIGDDALTAARNLSLKAFDCFVLDKPCDDSICKIEDSGGN